MLYVRRATLALSFGCALGCSSSASTYGGLTPCKSKVCGGLTGGDTPTGGSGGDGSGTGGSGGAGVSVDLRVGVVAGPSFDPASQSTTYTGTATIRAPGAIGDYIEAQYTGVTLTFPALAEGPGWMLVSKPADGLLPTFSAQTVPSATPLLLPVVDLVALQSIAAGFAGAPQIDPTRAQLLLLVRKGQLPLDGITLSTTPAMAFVGYDSFKQTGSLGLIVVINVPVPSEVDLPLTLTDGSSAVKASVHIGPGAATVATIAF